MIEISPMSSSHVQELVTLYEAAGVAYTQFFTPFLFTVAQIESILNSKKKDLYFVVLSDGQMAGFYMLRGFDQGYEVPAYGVWIAPNYSGKGLALATLQHAVATSRRLGCSKIMLKVHPKNIRAKQIYERFGFEFSGVDAKSMNLVYHYSISDDIAKC